MFISQKYEIRIINKKDIMGLIDIPIKQFLKRFGIFEDMDLIIGSNVLQSIINIKECPNKAIFIIPGIRWGRF